MRCFHTLSKARRRTDRQTVHASGAAPAAPSCIQALLSHLLHAGNEALERIDMAVLPDRGYGLPDELPEVLRQLAAEQRGVAEQLLLSRVIGLVIRIPQAYLLEQSESSQHQN